MAYEPHYLSPLFLALLFFLSSVVHFTCAGREGRDPPDAGGSRRKPWLYAVAMATLLAALACFADFFCKQRAFAYRKYFLTRSVRMFAEHYATATDEYRADKNYAHHETAAGVFYYRIIDVDGRGGVEIGVFERPGGQGAAFTVYGVDPPSGGVYTWKEGIAAEKIGRVNPYPSRDALAACLGRGAE